MNGEAGDVIAEPQEKRGPGRPRGSGTRRDSGRPRDLVDEFQELARGRLAPRTIQAGVETLRSLWGPFLSARGVASENVTIHDVIAWEEDLLADSFSRKDAKSLTMVRSYYTLKGNRHPDSKWSKLSGEIAGRRVPEIKSKLRPHEPFELALVPTILESSRTVKHYNVRGAEVYSEAYALTATFVYTGGRAQLYGLKVDQVRKALKTKVLELVVKTGKQVKLPVHDRLLEIWREHLEARDFDGPQMFRHGRDPYTYLEGAMAWEEDVRAASVNSQHVRLILHGDRYGDNVEKQLQTRFQVKERLTSHRFRKTLGTYLEEYGFTKKERNVLGAWKDEGMAEMYSMPNLARLQKKWSSVDFGSAEWVAAHWPPRNLFAGNGNEDLLAELLPQLEEANARARRAEESAARNEKRLDEVLRRLDAKVIA